MHTNTPEQEAVISLLLRQMKSDEPRHVCVEAVAGSAKTSLLVSLFERIMADDQPRNTILLAFNVAVAFQLHKRLTTAAAAGPGTSVNVSTIHGWAVGLCKQDVPGVQINENKVIRTIEQTFPGLSPPEVQHLREAVVTHRHGGIYPLAGGTEPVDTVLRAMLNDSTVIDQDDALYQAVHRRLRCGMPPFDLVAVDEAHPSGISHLAPGWA